MLDFQNPEPFLVYFSLENEFKIGEWSLETVLKRWSFLLRISSVNVTKQQETVDLVTFTEKIFNGKLHFLCSERLGGISVSITYSGI